MARNHFIVPTAPVAPGITARLGAAAGAANNLSDLDVNKIVKLSGESTYNLAVAGDDIEGVITSVESAPQNGWSIGGVSTKFHLMYVVFDGLQGTPGVGAVAIGDYVVAGSITAKGTALSSYPKVCKATAAGTGLNHKFRVVSLGSAGTGAVGTVGTIQRVA